MFTPLSAYSRLTAMLVAEKHERTEKGASFTEYVVLLALIVGIIVAVLGTGLQDALQGAIDNVVAQLNG